MFGQIFARPLLELLLLDLSFFFFFFLDLFLFLSLFLSLLLARPRPGERPDLSVPGEAVRPGELLPSLGLRRP